MAHKYVSTIKARICTSVNNIVIGVHRQSMWVCGITKPQTVCSRCPAFNVFSFAAEQMPIYALTNIAPLRILMASSLFEDISSIFELSSTC